MSLSDQELLDAAVASGLVAHDTLLQLKGQARLRGQSLVDAVTTACRFPRAALYRAAAEQRGIGCVDWEQAVPDSDLIPKLPAMLIQRRGILPVRQAGLSGLATDDPADHQTHEAAARLLGRQLPLLLADSYSLRLEIESQLAGAERPLPSGRLPAPSGQGRSAHRPDGAREDATGLLDRILDEAYLRRATDVHFEPCAEGLRVRLRVDGRMVVYLRRVHRSAGAAVLSRIKVLSRMDVTQQHRPLDGRFTHRVAGGPNLRIEIRVATAPTPRGERAALRLLEGPDDALSLADLGMTGETFRRAREVLHTRTGLMLVVGPTGSGKTTTLHAMLRELNHPDRNILTLEDPVEAMIEGVSHVTAGGNSGLGFAAGLRALLRHDPDVLMVGEIRDAETLDVAVKAALTGHLLLSTLHSNSAWGTITRLLDMGCDPRLLATVLTAVIAQRLVRRLCPHCRRSRPASHEESQQLNIPQDREVFEPVGCVHCLGTGYRGRVGLFAPLWIDNRVMRTISEGKLDERRAVEDSTLMSDGAVKVCEGISTPEEVLAACHRELRGG